MIFKELNKEIQKALAFENFTVPTPIQEKAIPVILNRKDIIGIAQTGTGKTASFVLPILNLLQLDKKKIIPNSPLVLVLTPTRELAMQIDLAFGSFGKYLDFKHTSVFGGVSVDDQITKLDAGIHILTATPGRLIDLISKNKVNLSNITYFVIDEAHMMLDMGFIDNVKEINERLPITKQSLCFSATISADVIKFAKKLLNKPTLVTLERRSRGNPLTQKVFYLYTENKNRLLIELIKNTGKTIVFLRTKYKTDKIEELLIKNNFSAVSIHSDKKQDERTKSIDNFKSGKARILVATDIAARGIHIDDITHVINYDIPNSPSVYVHRIGRTARAGKIGEAYSFCSMNERELQRDIEKHTGQTMTVMKHKYYARKIEKATLEEIKLATKKSKINKHKKVARRSKIKSEEYVPPINSKKKRAISLAKMRGNYKRV
jgi:ATP-dependent RNA helicase RhlE